MTIYCKECNEIGRRRRMPYCLKYDELLRAVPMDKSKTKFPVKCLKCIEKENEK